MDQEGRRGTETRDPPLIVAKGKTGFKVYSPIAMKTVYAVMGDDGNRVCSCGGADDGTPCAHIGAVEKCSAAAKGATAPASEAPADQSRAERKETTMAANGNSGVTIKRSISPDGRIDSLSVEIGFPVENLSMKEIKAKAETSMKLQAEIVEGFRNGAKHGNGLVGSGGNPKPEQGTGNGAAHSDTNGAVPAEIVGVGGMDGKWGRRLFLKVKGEDRMLRLYGTKKQLAEHLGKAGFEGSERDLSEGIELRLPCRIITKHGEHGSYLNIEQVLPAGNGHQGRGPR